MSEGTKAKPHKGTFVKGRTLSDETKKRIGDASRGRVFSEEHKRKISESNKKPHPIVMCPYCGKSGGSRNMKRWHFGNCKEIV
jgi:hypothetical protein